MKKEQKSGFGIVGIIIIIAIVAVLGGGYFAYKNYGENQVCSKDLKICPDGSHIGRVPPMCEFPECPAPSQISEIDISTWKTYRNEKYGYQINIPEDFQAISEYDGSLIPLDPMWDGSQIGNSQGNVIGIRALMKRDKSRDWTVWYIDTYIEKEYQTKVITIGSLNATEFYIPHKIKKNKYFYLFDSGDVLIGLNFYEDEKIARQILSTFKFIK